MTPTTSRYAVYYVPERGCPLERLGSPLLGRDIYSGGFLPRPGLGGAAPGSLLPPAREAGRYGLHATLKPPFFLKPGMTEDDLVNFAERFAKTRRPLALPPFAVERIGSFFALALCPRNKAEAEEAANVRSLAGEAVAFFDEFRAPPSDEDLAKRRAKGLTPRQEEYLLRWGYPYVFDEFRFHITLTDKIREPGLAATLETILRRYLAPAFAGNRITAVTVCRSDFRGDFTVLHRAEFSAGGRAPLEG